MNAIPETVRAPVEPNAAAVTSCAGSKKYYWFNDTFEHFFNGLKDDYAQTRGDLCFLLLGPYFLPFRQQNKRALFPDAAIRAEKTLELLHHYQKQLAAHAPAGEDVSFNVRVKLLAEAFSAGCQKKTDPLHPYMSTVKGVTERDVQSLDSYVKKPTNYESSRRFTEFFITLSTRPDKQAILEEILTYYQQLLDCLFPNELPNRTYIYQSLVRIGLPCRALERENSDGYHLLCYLLKNAFPAEELPDYLPDETSAPSEEISVGVTLPEPLFRYLVQTALQTEATLPVLKAYLPELSPADQQLLLELVRQRSDAVRAQQKALDKLDVQLESLLGI